jgi:hypothetical protein
MTGASRILANVTGNGAAVHVSRADGTPLLTHRIAPGERPSIHPLHAPDGNGIYTQDRPAHHPWQRGLYTGFNLVNGIGFWRDRPEDGTFDPRLAAGPEVGGSSVRWSIDNAWNAPDGTRLIAERQDWVLVDHGKTYDLELAWSLTARIDVEIGQFMAGGLFLRMPWSAETGGVAVNSEQQYNADAERRRARWVAVSMPVAGRQDWGGIAMMDHPGNPAHPVTWRVDNELGISPSRVIAERWTIPAGATERYRYRLHVFSGTVDPGVLEERWRQFAADPAEGGTTDETPV